MKNIEAIESAHGGPLVVRVAGEPVTIPDPADLPFQLVLACLQAEHAPDTPAVASWKRPLVFGAWQAHYDLPDYQSAQRLTYLIDNYRSSLVYDLQTIGVDLGQMWRSRRWRTLLDHIDHLPGHSWYSAAISGNEEHARMIAESIRAREDEGEKMPSGPSMHGWTPEVAAITVLTDEVRRLQYVTLAAAGDKTASPPEPLPRPDSPLERALRTSKRQARQEKHDALVARLIRKPTPS